MQQYNLWFVNPPASSGGSGGHACVYQDKGNVASNQEFSLLAWMLTPLNPGVTVRFIWTIDYDFAWFDYTNKTQQIKPADLSNNNLRILSYNQFGYSFKPPQQHDPSGTLYINQDQNIPPVDSTYVGIGMHNAGTFAHPASPNLNLKFTPSSELTYWISFGQYIFEVNDPISAANMNNPGKISFPPGVYSMTATLSTNNTWSIKPGEPAFTSQARTFASNLIVYEAGKGITSQNF